MKLSVESRRSCNEIAGFSAKGFISTWVLEVVTNTGFFILWSFRLPSDAKETMKTKWSNCLLCCFANYKSLDDSIPSSIVNALGPVTRITEPVLIPAGHDG
ncbi:hypothetical protein SUGI_0679760 [Cryptomeria japonica]|nr:hypothetical protein SUGI_0679760 [Cryptomeria japonica]